MPAAYDVMTVHELRDFLGAYFRNRLPTQRLGQSSDNAKRLQVTVGATALTHKHLLALHDALSPLRARGAFLTELLEAFGLERLPATPARGLAAGRVRGTVGAAYATTDELTHQVSQLRFRLGGAGTIPAAGEIDVDVAGISTGSQTRLAAGEVLTFDVTPAGLEATVELQGPLDLDGLDQEEDGDARARLLERLSARPEGGNETDWRLWVLAIAGVHRVYLYAHRNGLGSVDVVALHAGSGSTRILSPSENAAVLAYLTPALRPITATPRVLEVVADPRVLRVTVQPRPDVVYARDWQDTAPPVVLAYSVGSRVLQFTTARPADLKVGDRLVWDAAGGDGVLVDVDGVSTLLPHVVQALVGADTVVLTREPSTAPTGGLSIYAGGALTAPLYAAFQAAIDQLGPARGEHGGDWQDGLRRDVITAAAFDVAGLFSITINTPSSDYVPNDYGYPDDDQVALVTLSRMFVRYG